MMTEVVNVEAAPNNNAAPTANKSGAGDNRPLAWLRINLDYFRTPPGLAKIAQAILGIVCMSLASPAILSGTHFFLFVATSAFIATLLWIFVYLLGIREALTFPIDWVLTELLNTGIFTVLYVIAFIVQLAVWAPSGYRNYRATNLAAGVFGIFNTIAYGFGAYLLYLEHKNRRTTN